jgi:hypothetical protein
MWVLLRHPRFGGAKSCNGSSVSFHPLARPSPQFIPITLLGQTAHLYRMPAELAHQFCQPPASAGCSLALRYFENIEDGLCADSLDAITRDFASETFERQSPGIGIAFTRPGAGLIQNINEGHFLPLEPLVGISLSVNAAWNRNSIYVGYLSPPHTPEWAHGADETAKTLMDR